jgi:hypothetical protein
VSTSVHEDWLEVNQRELMGEVRRVGELLRRHAGLDPLNETTPPPVESERPTALEALCAAFHLSEFERDVLILCAGMELDSGFPELCAAAQGDPGRAYPTFGLALAVLPNAHWGALAPSAPLRHWRLVDLATSGPSAITQAPLRIEERVLHNLTGISFMDDRLNGMVEPYRAVGKTPATHRALANRIAGTWSRMASHELPVVQLWGPAGEELREVASLASAELGFSLAIMSAEALPAEPRDVNAFVELWSREAGLDRRCLLLDCSDTIPDRAREAAIGRLIETCTFPLIVAGREPRRARQRTLLGFELPPLSVTEQRHLWEAELGSAAAALNGELSTILSQFRLSPSGIHAACADTFGRLAQWGEEPTASQMAAALWEACRVQARMPLDELAMRVDSVAGWDDLVLPEAQLAQLREIAIQMRQRGVVYDRWGFARKAGRGLGITALFSGVSGTGKTLAAEVLANSLRLDLYRIDLSQVVSKYIGETERNLKRVFDAAEPGGALVFDEADALFGKRSEVKDSHDRYANIEVSYLLQRMEAYRGLAILTTNLKESLDPAFLRRIRFIVNFPFPSEELRAEIWRHIFPAETPLDQVDPLRLARLDVAGGNIRNIAMHGAFLAAESKEHVGMRHLLIAAGSECSKIGKPLTAAEVGSWSN